MSKRGSALYQLKLIRSHSLAIIIFGVMVLIAQPCSAIPDARRASNDYARTVFAENASWDVILAGNLTRRDLKFSQRDILVILFMLVLEPALIIVLLIEMRRRRDAQDLIAHDFAGERVLTRISTSLADCTPEQVDTEIETGLRELVEAEGVDSADWLVLRADGVKKSYCVNRNREGGCSALDLSRMPWSMGQLTHGKQVVVNTLQDLPQAASFDKFYFLEQQVKSAALVPCGFNGSRGALAIVCTSRERAWPESVLSRLAVLGNIITNAVMRKETQEAKQAIEQRFYRLFEQAPLGIALEDLDGRLLFANPALCSMLGYNQHEIHGMTCKEFATPEELAIDLALFQELQNGSKEAYNVEKHLVRKDGTRMHARVNVSRLKFQTPGEPVIMAMVEDVTQEHETGNKLKQAESALHELPSRLINAQEEERQRIARELHDDIGQRLSLAIIRLGEVNRQTPESLSSPHSDFGSIVDELDELTSDVHRLSHQLHSSKLQHLGLKSALNELCRQMTQQHKLEVVQEIEDAPDLPSQAQLCLYRVAQEALNNVVRHSRASKVSIRFSVEHAVARLDIADDGRGFNVSSATASGLGLASMRERLHAINGELSVSALERRGTRIIATVSIEDNLSLKKAI